MGIVLRQIIPNGTQWGELGELLPDWSNLEFGQDLKSPSSIKFEYPNQGANFKTLKTGTYVVVEVDGNYKWWDSIFYINELSGSDMPDTPGTTTFGGVSLRKKLDNTRWMPAIGSAYIDSEGFRYTNVTPGDVINAGIINYKSRSTSRYKDEVDWIASVNKGTGWAYRVDEIIQPTTSVTEIISKYQEMGIASARFAGFTLVCGHYDWFVNHPSRDLSDTVQLKVGVNLTEANYSESDDNIITALLVKGAEDPFKSAEPNNLQTNSIQWVIASQAVINKYGYREGILEVSDASNPTTLQQIGKNYINRNLEPRFSYSYTMVDHLYDPRTGQALDTPNVLSDFQCGDAILVLNERGASTYSVYAITLSYDNPTRPASIGLTLNDYFDSWQVKFDQRLRRLGG